VLSPIHRGIDVKNTTFLHLKVRNSERRHRKPLHSTLHSEDRRFFFEMSDFGALFDLLGNRHPWPLELVISRFIQRTIRNFKNAHLKKAQGHRDKLLLALRGYSAQGGNDSATKHSHTFHLPNGFLLLLSPWRVFNAYIKFPVSSLYEAPENEI